MTRILPAEISDYSPASSTSSHAPFHTPGIDIDIDIRQEDPLFPSLLPSHFLHPFPEPLDELILPDNMRFNVPSPTTTPTTTTTADDRVNQSPDLLAFDGAPADSLLPHPVSVQPPASIPLPVSIAPGLAASRSVSPQLDPQDTSMSISISPSAENAKLACRRLERRAKLLASTQYEAAHSNNTANNNNTKMCTIQRRKRVRNKSAYVSRHSRRVYSDLLAAHYTEAVDEREQLRTSVGGLHAEISELRRLLALADNNPSII